VEIFDVSSEKKMVPASGHDKPVSAAPAFVGDRITVTDGIKSKTYSAVTVSGGCKPGFKPEFVRAKRDNISFLTIPIFHAHYSTLSLTISLFPSHSFTIHPKRVFISAGAYVGAYGECIASW
jgi:hypothetical protein